MSKGGPPARQHCKILDGENEIGEVTSGCPSPTLGNGINVAIGYVPLGTIHKLRRHDFEDFNPTPSLKIFLHNLI